MKTFESKRNITPKQRKEGFLIGAQDITDYEIQIDIGNYKNKDIKIRVIDQIPKTNNPKISIGEVSSSHKFKQKPDANGNFILGDRNPSTGNKTNHT